MPWICTKKAPLIIPCYETNELGIQCVTYIDEHNIKKADWSATILKKKFQPSTYRSKKKNKY